MPAMVTDKKAMEAEYQHRKPARITTQNQQALALLTRQGCAVVQWHERVVAVPQHELEPKL